ncbi:AAEL004915-PA [Aedes aegypti]|uniref:AAEL004915-PA n=2 Tax=Aedes aegypti TaxID=7159 RepID=A0A1S4F903_AEDAE|nr:uncharacterized protein LOC5565656 [Aedes aegypti]EAT43664.1 AAEL004915-PA [Aedes aegypti]
MSLNVRLVGLVVVMLFGIQHNRVAAYQDAFTTTELSYSFGRRADADVLCFEKQLVKGTTLPATISQTQATNIRYITLVADKYYKDGFRATVTPALPVMATNVRVDGKPVLPYSILIQFWCAP